MALIQMKRSDIPKVREELRIKQNNKCLICGKEFTDKIRPVLDHNHSSWMVRGVLCRECNILEAKYYNAFVRVGARNKGIDYVTMLKGLIRYFGIKDTKYIYPPKPKKRKVSNKKQRVSVKRKKNGKKKTKTRKVKHS